MCENNYKIGYLNKLTLTIDITQYYITDIKYTSSKTDKTDFLSHLIYS